MFFEWKSFICSSSPQLKDCIEFRPQITNGYVVDVYDGDTITIATKYPNLKNQILDDIMTQKANIEEIHSQIVTNSEIIDNEPKQGNNGVETS